MRGDASKADLERARRRGDVVVSRRLLAAAGLLATCALLPWCIGEAFRHAKSSLVAVLSEADAAGHGANAWQIVAPVLTTVVPVAAAVALVTLLAAYAQGGGRFAKRRAPRLAFEGPLSAVFGAVAFVTALTLGGWLALRASRPFEPSTTLEEATFAQSSEQLERTRHAAARSFEGVFSEAGAEATTLLLCAAALACFLGLLDLLLARFTWQRRIAAWSEASRDARNAEVAPEIRRARQRAHRALGSGARVGSGEE